MYSKLVTMTVILATCLSQVGLSSSQQPRGSSLDSGKALVIEVCKSMDGSNSSPDAMVVSVGMGASVWGHHLSQEKPTPRPTHSSARKPTVAQTRKQTVTPTRYPTVIPTRTSTVAPYRRQ
jgi:hypothetical protein